MQEFIALRFFFYDLKFKFSNLSIIQFIISYLLIIKSKGDKILDIIVKPEVSSTDINYTLNTTMQAGRSSFVNKRFFTSKSGEGLTEPVKIRKCKGPVTPFASEPTELLREIIFGLMLGDLYAERSSTKGNTRLRFYMSTVNKEYATHLFRIFKEYVKTPPKEYTRKLSKLTGKIHTNIAFSTLKYSFFNWAMEDFYRKDPVLNRNIKFLPLNADEQFTAVSLAYLIMDDGSYHKKGHYLILCTDSFSEEDVLRLIYILKNKFNLFCALIVRKKDKAYRIRINKSAMPHLISLVKPHMIPSMYYKLGL